MMKKGLFLIGLILLSGLVSAGEMINLKRTGYDEVAYPGSLVPVFLNIKNVHNHMLEDVQVRIEIIGLEEFGLSDAYDINDGDSSSFVVLLNIPVDAQRGIYPMRMTVTDDDDLSRSYYRYIMIR